MFNRTDASTAKKGEHALVLEEAEAPSVLPYLVSARTRSLAPAKATKRWKR